MKIVIAPDSFKESLTATKVASVIAAGLGDALPGAQCVCIPLADGGEGTVDAFIAARGGAYKGLRVTGPRGAPVEAHYGVLDGGRTAVVELAQASGLVLVPVAERDPRLATSYGTGELMRAAITGGCETLIVGIGGSATNDGGAGLLQALGVSFRDGDGKELPAPIRAVDLARVASVNSQDLLPRAREVRILVACDVDNPLLGPRGASAVFGPQKGADAATVAELEETLATLYAIIERTLDISVIDRPGAGAAGGVGAALLAVLGAELRPGIELVMEAAGLAAQIRSADLVVTGEGRLDGQTMNGKAPLGVARAARAAGVPVVAIGGGLFDDVEGLIGDGFDAVEVAVTRPMTTEDALSDASARVRRAAYRAGCWIALGRRLSRP